MNHLYGISFVEDSETLISIHQKCSYSLKDYVLELRKKNELSDKISLDLSKQVASVISYLHSKKTVHLDLKPANFLVQLSVD